MLILSRPAIITLMVCWAIATNSSRTQSPAGFCMQMTTSGYISAIQGIRAVWGWWRKSEEESDSEHDRRLKALQEAREFALAQAEAEQEIALKHAETTSMLATARAEVQEQRLRPVMAMYEQVQANKRARLQIAQEATLAARDD